MYTGNMDDICPQSVHIELRVRDLDASVAFYSQVFGVEPEYREGASYALFSLQGLDLLLLTGEVSITRFGFKLADEQALGPLVEALSQQGLETVRRQFYHPALKMNEVAVNLTDPDGHRCSFYCLVGEQADP